MSDNCFSLPCVTVVPSLLCNLKCKHCGTPYLKNKLERSNDEIMKDVERFFKIVDRVEKIFVHGGEPLLYKGLPDLLERILTYSDRFGGLRIITNGTIVPSKDTLNVLKKYGEKFRHLMIDDYGPILSKKIPEIKEALEKENIPFFVRDYWTENAYDGGWYDLGNSEGFLRVLHTPEEAQEIYEKCSVSMSSSCSTIFNGIWSPCDPVFRRIDLGLSVDINDYVDLTDENKTVEQQREKIRKILDEKCLDVCKYCKGMCKDSVRVKAAEQLTSEEFQQITKDLWGM